MLISCPIGPVSRTLSLASVAALINLLSPLAGRSQAVLPKWELIGPELEIGSNVDLFNVRGAVELPRSRIAIANAGNYEVLILSEEGRVLGSLGRRGEGPGEFRALLGVSALADTLVSREPGRMSVWLPEGGHQSTYRFPTYEEAPVDLQGVITTEKLVATSRSIVDPRERAGLRDEHVDLLLLDRSLSQPMRLATLLRARVYQYVNDAGTRTVYRVPFLGRTQIAVAGNRVVIAPLDSTHLSIWDVEAGAWQRIGLPIVREAFDPSIVIAYRDSLLAALSPASRQRFPFAARQIREIYNRSFPVPVLMPSIVSLVASGNRALVEVSVRSTTNTARWILVDFDAGPIGTLTLPRSQRIIGGTQNMEKVFVLARDSLDVEYVRIYSLSLSSSEK